MKDWIKVLIASLTGTLVTLIISSLFAYPGNIKQQFKETDLKIIEVETKSKDYTDKRIKEHEINEEDKYKSLDDKIEKQYKMIEFLYQRELTKK